MAARYDVTNSIDTMMIKNVSQTAIVGANGAIVVCVVTLTNVSMTTQNNNINLGISGFGIGIPNNLCCIQTIQITI